MTAGWDASGWVWTTLAGPYLAAAALLVVAGVPKLGDPMPLVRALRSAGWPAGRGLVRAFAAGEVVVGLLALVRPSLVTGLLLALSYAGFTAFVVAALRRGGVLASCGCFGKADTPPSVAHAVLTGAAAVVALLVAVAPPTAPWSGLTLVASLALLLVTGLVGFLAWQVMAVLPAVTPAAVRSAGRAPAREASRP